MALPYTTKPYQYTTQQFIEAIKGSGGNITTIARRVGCSWDTAKKYITKRPTVQRAFQNEKEGILDLAEDKLVEAINRNEPWAVKFILQTIGKKRGFTERMEVTGADDGPIILRYTGNSDPGEL